MAVLGSVQVGARVRLRDGRVGELVSFGKRDHAPSSFLYPGSVVVNKVETFWNATIKLDNGSYVSVENLTEEVEVL